MNVYAKLVHKQTSKLLGVIADSPPKVQVDSQIDRHFCYPDLIDPSIPEPKKFITAGQSRSIDWSRIFLHVRA
jgi:hypothetical protein